MNAVTYMKESAQGKIRLVKISSCPVCGSEKHSKWKESKGWNLTKCNNCGFIFLNPRPNKNYFKNLYDPLSQYTYKVDGEEYINRESEFIKAYHRQLQDVERLVSKGRLLEIGSALSFLLEAARQRGWTPYGVELSQGGADYCRKKYGINVHCGEVQDAAFPSGYFNCVMIIHTLEHVYNPNVVVKECARVLKTGGLLVIEIPYIKDIDTTGDSDGLMKLPMHLNFTVKTLKSLLDSNGFIILDIQEGEALRVNAKKALHEIVKDERVLLQHYELLNKFEEHLYVRGLYLDAIKCFHLLLNLFPAEVKVYNNLGSVLWTIGDKKTALENFIKAVSLDNACWEALMNLILSSRELKKELVKPFIEKYTRKYLDGKWAKKIVKMFSELPEEY